MFAPGLGEIGILGLGREFMVFSSAAMVISTFARSTRTALWTYPAVHAQAAILFSLAVRVEYHTRRSDVYNVLWAVVFGFATLNILNLTARRFEPTKRGLSFGELLAVVVVLLSVFLLGW
jgi:hypothetical protein